MTPPAPAAKERRPREAPPRNLDFAFIFYSVLVLLAAAVAGFVLKAQVDDQTLTADFWKETLKIATLAAVPVIFVAMRGPFMARARKWRAISAFAVFVALLVVLAVATVCLANLGPAVPKGADGEDLPLPPPSTLELYIATIGVAVTIAAPALSVVITFLVGAKQAALDSAATWPTNARSSVGAADRQTQRLPESLLPSGRIGPANQWPPAQRSRRRLNCRIEGERGGDGPAIAASS